MATREYIDIVFDDSPGSVSGRFVEVEDPSGASINAGVWVQQVGEPWYWRLRIRPEAFEIPDEPA